MKKIKKLAPMLLTVAIACSIIIGCSAESNNANSAGEEKEKEDKVLQYQRVPGSVYFPELAEDLGYLGDLTLENVSNYTGGPESIQLTATGETDFGMAFNGAIIKSYSKNIKIKSVIGAYGSDKATYIGAFVLKESPIKSAKDFIGKKVGVNILGAHSEFITKDFLRKGGLSEEEIKDVTLVTVPSANAEQALRNELIDVVLLQSIAKDFAVERGGIQEVFNDIEVFGSEFTAGNYFFTQKYIDENPTTVKQFTEGVAKAIDWAQTTPKEEVIARFERIISARDTNEMTQNLEFWKSTGIATEGGTIEDAEYEVWIDWLVRNGELKEGQIKPEELYTNEFNPYDK